MVICQLTLKMAEEIHFENRRISNFKGLVTLTLDRVIQQWHTVVHHSSTSTYIPNFIGWTDGWTYGHSEPIQRLLGWLFRVDLKTKSSTSNCTILPVCCGLSLFRTSKLIVFWICNYACLFLDLGIFVCIYEGLNFLSTLCFHMSMSMSMSIVDLYSA